MWQFSEIRLRSPGFGMARVAAVFRRPNVGHPMQAKSQLIEYEHGFAAIEMLSSDLPKSLIRRRFSSQSIADLFTPSDQRTSRRRLSFAATCDRIICGA